MIQLARPGLLLAFSAIVSWWLFLRTPPLTPPDTAPGRPTASVTVVPEVIAMATPPPTESTDTANPADPDEPDLSASGPPPAELGRPDGTGSATGLEPTKQQAAPKPLESETSSIDSLLTDRRLRAEAEAELATASKPGFATVLLASPDKQLEIARFFGEELVLVPHTAIDPRTTKPCYYRLNIENQPFVEKITARPPLDGYRQYRDLFDYPYAKLSKPIRALRRRVPARSQTYLFAALIPVGEWAVVIGRRRDALIKSGRPLDEVQRFVMRYIALGSGRFDLRVDQIVFADGSRFEPTLTR